VDKLIKIESLFKESADRFLSDAQLRPDPALVAEGWQRRFTVDEPRAQEVQELYAQLGYEVRREPLREAESQDDCHLCLTSAALRLCTIYTRKA